MEVLLMTTLVLGLLERINEIIKVENYIKKNLGIKNYQIKLY